MNDSGRSAILRVLYCRTYITGYAGGVRKGGAWRPRSHSEVKKSEQKFSYDIKLSLFAVTGFW